jgi:hypothetical protein
MSAVVSGGSGRSGTRPSAEPSSRPQVTEAARPSVRAVALPSEHGGWGLTLEPGLLGLLVAPSAAGACLALAAMVAFLARTPSKLAVVDHRRGRSLPRTVLARRVAAAEIAVLAALVGTALVLADAAFWVPAVVAAPLVIVEAWFDVRSRGRRLVPELAGAVGVCSVASMVVLADGRSAGLAAAVWLVLAARAVTSIPHVREQIARLHERPITPAITRLADVAAVVLAVTAVAVDHRLLAGAVAVGALVVVQRLAALRPIPRAVVLGVRQTLFGLAVVVAAAIGVLATAG